MTTEEQVQRLDMRVTAIENDVWNKLTLLDEKITALTIAVTSNHCPAPGKCLQLETALGSAVLRIEKLELQWIDFIKWRAWLTGIFLAINFCFGTAITVLLGYIVKKL